MTYWTGKHRSEETKEKIRQKLIGRTWKPQRLCLVCGKDGVRKDRKYCSQSCASIAYKGHTSPMKGKIFGDDFREKVSKGKLGKKPWNYGKPNLKGRGENCHLWKGGVTKINYKIRTSIEYKQWVRAVFERDKHTCRHCGKKGGTMSAHHIKDFATHPDLRLEVSNGLTLCLLCHQKTDSYPKGLH